jgi:hypothetical protein
VVHRPERPAHTAASPPARLYTRWPLDAATYQYRAESLLEHGVVLTYPFKVAVPFEELIE